MDEIEPLNLERDPRFPSGPWTGFYLQYWLPGRHPMELDLTFSDGAVDGKGEDTVGPFTIAGQYDLVTGECKWAKQYIGRHCVYYKGVNEGAGIWGVWELPQMMGLFTDRGGFHVWPQGDVVEEESEEAEQVLLTLMRKHFGSKLIRAVCYGAISAVVVFAAVFLLRHALK